MTLKVCMVYVAAMLVLVIVGNVIGYVKDDYLGVHVGYIAQTALLGGAILYLLHALRKLEKEWYKLQREKNSRFGR